MNPPTGRRTRRSSNSTGCPAGHSSPVSQRSLREILGEMHAARSNTHTRTRKHIYIYINFLRWIGGRKLITSPSVYHRNDQSLHKTVQTCVRTRRTRPFSPPTLPRDPLTPNLTQCARERLASISRNGGCILIGAFACEDGKSAAFSSRVFLPVPVTLETEGASPPLDLSHFLSERWFLDRSINTTDNDDNESQ